jgi:hypothetical protein
METQIKPLTLGANTSSQISAPYAIYEPLTVQACLSAYSGQTIHVFELEAAKHNIKEFAQLPENWDGYGALPIQQGTMCNALAAADQLLGSAPIPDIAPNPNGTISMEWESGSGTAFFEIGQTKYSFFIDLEGGTPIYADGAADAVLPYLGLLIKETLFSAPIDVTTSITVGGNVRLAGPGSGY